jgi:hypothetical protein
MMLLGTRNPVTATVTKRFNAKWKLDQHSGCHLWTAAACSSGYGTMKVGGKKGLAQAAHRLSWELNCGPIPAGMCVLHKCDTPACVNPAHLFLGTKQDNSDDAVRKGRTALLNTFRGERSTSAKLTDATVREILTSPESRSLIARRLGISASNIKKIRVRQTWTHVQLTEAEEALRLLRSSDFNGRKNSLRPTMEAV